MNKDGFDGAKIAAALLGLLSVMEMGEQSAEAQQSGGITQSGNFTGNDAACIAGTNGVSDCGYVGNAPAFALNFNPGAMTALTLNKPLNVAKIPKAATVDNLELIAQTFTCTGNPVIGMFECGTSATCTSPTTIGSGTLTAAGTVVDASVSNPSIVAGDYVGFEITAGTCSVLDASAVALVHYL